VSEIRGWSHEAQDEAEAQEPDEPPQFEQVARTWPIGRFLLVSAAVLILGGVVTAIVLALN
jgi:hypothetical protein